MNMKTMMLGLMGLAASTMILRAEDDATLPVAQRLMRIDLDVAVRHYEKLQDTLRDSKLELLMNDGRLGANHPEQDKLQRKIEILTKLTDETRMEILDLGHQLDKIAEESTRAMAMNGMGLPPGFAVQRGIGGITVMDPTTVAPIAGGGGVGGFPGGAQPQFGPGSTAAPAGAVIPGGAPAAGIGFSAGGPPSATPLPRGRVGMPGATPMAPPVPVPGSALPGGPPAGTSPAVQPMPGGITVPGLPPVAPPIEVRPEPTPPAIPAGPPEAGGPGAGMAPPAAEAPAATPAPAAPELAPAAPELAPAAPELAPVEPEQ